MTMGRSRYAGTTIIDGHYETWDDPAAANPLGPDILDGVKTVDHIYQAGDRLEIIAHKYYGDEEYWWVIALANRIIDPFAIPVGTTLHIPTEVKVILDKLPR